MFAGVQKVVVEFILSTKVTNFMSKNAIQYDTIDV